MVNETNRSARARGSGRRGDLAALIFGLLAVGGLGAYLGLVGTEANRLVGPARVADGDSLEVGTERVRLAGIDAPELAQDCGRPTGAYRCGQEARRHLAKLVAGQPVVCETTGRDRFGRILGICSVKGQELNRQMVLDGWAIDYGGGYLIEEARARAKYLGLWSGDFEDPQAFRRANRSDATGLGGDLPD